jgi:hypothetical protein
MIPPSYKPRKKFMECLAKDRWNILYIERWLKAPMQEEDEERHMCWGNRAPLEERAWHVTSF